MNTDNAPRRHEDKVFVKAAVIARLYSVTPSTVYKWAKERKIPCVAFQGTVRFDLDAVRAVIERGCS